MDEEDDEEAGEGRGNKCVPTEAEQRAVGPENGRVLAYLMSTYLPASMYAYAYISCDTKVQRA